ncbi:MAG: toll/interleukin-1 receptor domain-containing protein, partial [Bradyrhizobium sp.]|nr:toll/interleukin-1 receptor domain-containing protein [Bradyrhizobium sp.]
MLIDSLFALVAAAFPLPHLPPTEPDFILAGLPSGAIKLAIRNLPILVHFGAAGFFIAGVWAASRLYSSTSREVGLSSDRSGKAHSEITSELAAQFSLHDAKESASAASPNTAIDHDEAPVQTPPGDSSKPVNIAAFAPPTVAPGDDFYIQVVIHSPEQLADAKAVAEELDAATTLFKTVPLKLPLSHGDKVRIAIESRGAEIQSPDQEFMWRGYVAHVAYAARLPTRFGARKYKPLIRVFVNGAPAGIIELRLQAIPDSDGATSAPVAEKALRFNKVFLSYASADRPKVLDMVKMLKAQKIDYFHDLLSLEPGQRWKEEIYTQIAGCDAFYLFWSSNAKRSEWVIREATLALQNQRNSPDGIPHFLPIIIEGPPVVEPPPELSEFN